LRTKGSLSEEDYFDLVDRLKQIKSRSLFRDSVCLSNTSIFIRITSYYGLDSVKKMGRFASPHGMDLMLTKLFKDMEYAPSLTFYH
jgi:hypothetical protein